MQFKIHNEMRARRIIERAGFDPLVHSLQPLAGALGPAGLNGVMLIGVLFNRSDLKVAERLRQVPRTDLYRPLMHMVSSACPRRCPRLRGACPSGLGGILKANPRNLTGAEKLSAGDVNVCLDGERGTGEKVIARPRKTETACLPSHSRPSYCGHPEPSLLKAGATPTRRARHPAHSGEERGPEEGLGCGNASRPEDIPLLVEHRLECYSTPYTNPRRRTGLVRRRHSPAVATLANSTFSLDFALPAVARRHLLSVRRKNVDGNRTDTTKVLRSIRCLRLQPQGDARDGSISPTPVGERDQGAQTLQPAIEQEVDFCITTRTRSAHANGTSDLCDNSRGTMLAAVTDRHADTPSKCSARTIQT